MPREHNPDGARWVCLIYHDVTAADPRSGSAEFFAVSQARFGRQLDLIRDHGWRGCSIADALVDATRSVAISFDDGDLGQAVRAFPALAGRGMTATFFVTTAWIGTPGYASWEQLREMRAAGMSIQSHTHSHPFLSELSGEQLRTELRRSRDLLDERLGQRTTMLAFPGGDAPKRHLRGMLVDEGYSVLGTSRWGTNGPRATQAPQMIRRCTVRGSPSDADFLSVVRGDRWLSLRKQTRERVLAFARTSMGPTRYARWRRVVLGEGTSQTA